ncbi:helix-turn-helix domain-containing protein [Spirillospora sp. CA-253888]
MTATITSLKTTAGGAKPMTSARYSSTLRLRRLSSIIRERREAAGLTASEVSKMLGWSPGRLNNWELNKWSRPDVDLIARLLDVYGVTDPGEREKILTIARECRTPGWWQAHSKEITPEYSTYIGLEAGASAVCIADLVVFPGLLQTEDYARAIILGGPAQISTEQIERHLAVRMRRQKLLTRAEDPLRAWTVLDEAALRRQIGGPKVMRDQLDHICQLSELPNVTVQVVPFDRGAHPATANAFVILQFPEEDGPDAVYSETLSGELFTEIPAAVRDYHVAFRALQADAPDPRTSIDFIASVRDGRA